MVGLDKDRWPGDGPSSFLGAERYLGSMSIFSRLFSGRNEGTPRVAVHEAFNGLIRVYGVPSVVVQEPAEEVREGDGFIVHVLKYRLDTDPVPLTFSAKVYALHPDTGAPEDTSGTDWSGLFGGLFAPEPEVIVIRTGQTTMTEQVPAMEAMITGKERETGVLLRIRERRSVQAQLLMIVTVSGPLDLMEAQKDQVDGWFDGVAFDPSMMG